MYLEIKTFSQLTQAEKEDWERLVSSDEKGAFHSSLAWLEAVNATDDRPQYMALIKQEQGGLRAGLLFEEISESFDDDHYRLASLLEGYSTYYDVGAVPQLAPEMIAYPYASVTRRGSTSADFRYYPDCQSDEVMMMLDRLVKGIKARYGFVSFLYVAEDDRYLPTYLRQNHYQAMLLTARYYLPTMPKAAYLAQFRSRRRRKIEGEQAHFDRYGLEINRVAYNEDNLRQFILWVKANFEKYGFEGFGIDFAYKRYKTMLDTLLPEDIYFYQVKHGQKVFGGLLCFKYRDVLYGYQLGFDYAYLKPEWSAYFLLAYHYSQDLARQLEVKYLQVYDGLDDTKLSRRAIGEKLYAFIPKTVKLQAQADLVDKRVSQILERLESQYPRRNYDSD